MRIWQDSVWKGNTPSFPSATHVSNSEHPLNKNNAEKFAGNDFMFQLTRNEFDEILR